MTGHDLAETYGVDEPQYTARMPHTLDLYWDFSSPFAYLGTTQAEALAARTGATLRWKPMLLGGLFRSIGQADAPLLTWSDAKREHSMRDLERWAAHYGVPFRFPTKFPVSSVKAMRSWLALPEEERGAFRERTFRAYWAEGKDIGDETVLGELLGAHAADVLARIQTPEVKQQLIAATDAAVARGVFGAPTWVVDDRDLYWGQDRLPLVERALTGA
ncbi:MAG: 2-hydroxychromene-2-carboxylate isomerase [Proteobacteria bacterium]|nr:MAG: 2-hydroxychromene-2-carboxylate isomerase [Pseudomonadota bacterium]